MGAAPRPRSLALAHRRAWQGLLPAEPLSCSDSQEQIGGHTVMIPSSFRNLAHFQTRPWLGDHQSLSWENAKDSTWGERACRLRGEGESGFLQIPDEDQCPHPGKEATFHCHLPLLPSLLGEPLCQSLCWGQTRRWASITADPAVTLPGSGCLWLHDQREAGLLVDVPGHFQEP